MEPDFSRATLAVRLSRLERWKALAFGLAVCERMFPVFGVFTARTGHIGSDVIRSALDEAWNALLAGQERVDLSVWAEKCSDIAPDMDDYDELYASAALDAAASTATLMDAMSGDHVGAVADIGSAAFDTVDMLVQQYENFDSEVPGFEDRILQHPLMQGSRREHCGADLIQRNRLKSTQ